MLRVACKGPFGRVNNDPSALSLYTDGSRHHAHGHRRTGAGFAAYSQGTEVRAGRWGLGRRADNYDAEMIALAGAGAAAADWHRDHPQTKLFVFLTDNQSAIRTIADTTDHPAQLASIIFRRRVDAILNADATARIEILWVPGHKGFAGNERADNIAKAAVNDPPVIHTTITWARGKAKLRAVKAWRREWQSLPHTNQTATALQNTPPSLRLAPILRQTDIPRNVQTRIIHAITGHGHIGSYYSQIIPAESPACPCGEPLQSRSHVISDCERHDDARHHLHEVSSDLSTAFIIGTRKGLSALSRFLKDSDAFKKTQSETQVQASPNRGHDDDPPD
jgi:ribonuclease HI